MERADNMIGDGLRRGSDDGAVGDRVVDGMAPYGGLPAAARDGCDDLDGDDDFDGDGPAGDGCGERYEHFAITVDRGQSMIRLDKFLVDRMEHCSRNRIQTAADNGSILVNGVAAKASYKVKPLDRITMVMPYPKREVEIVPEAIPLDIVYEDDDLLIVNKPAGMVVHPGCGNYSGTLVNALAYHLRHLQMFSGGRMRAGLVHRIDKNTSGLIVLAKNALAAGLLTAQAAHKVMRHDYLTVCTGMLPDEGTIDAPIGRADGSVIRREVRPDGDRAVTHFVRLAQRDGYSLARVWLDTGRTHQIRVHFAHIGHPLPGDFLYCPDFSRIQRHALHAGALWLRQPVTGQPLHFTAPLPDDMQVFFPDFAG